MRTQALFTAAIFTFGIGCSSLDDQHPNAGSGGNAGSSGSTTAGTTSATGTTGSTTGNTTTGTTGSTVVGAGTTGAGGSSSTGTTGVAGSTSAGGSSGSGGSGGTIGSGGTGGSTSTKDAGADASSGKDASGSDAPVSGGPGCVGVTAKFCDDFEKQTGTAPTGDFTVSGAITVDSTKASSGTKSLHWKPTATAQLVFTKQFPFNDLFGRMMMFMVTTPTTGSHWDIIQSNNAGGTQWEVGGQTGNFELVCDPPDNGLDSKTKFPSGKWVCLQWEFKFGGAGVDNSFLTQVDGVPVDQGKFTGANSKGEKWVAGAWRDLHVGWEIFGGTTAVEFWIDDLAFGDQPIPCPTP